MVLFLFLELLRRNFVGSILSDLFMKQIQLIIIVLIIILGVFCYTLLQPGLWKNQLSHYCNNTLLKGNLWKIDLGELKGNLLTNIIGRGTKIHHPDGYSIELSDWSVKLNLWNTLIQMPTFESIDINKMAVHTLIPEGNIPDSLTSFPRIIPDTFLDFQVKRFLISGSINAEKKFNPIAIHSQGSVEALDNILDIQLNNCVIIDSTYLGNLEIDLCKINLKAQDQTILLELDANWKNTPIHYSFSLDENRDQFIESNLEFKHFSLGEYLPDFPKINPDFKQLSGTIFFNAGKENTKTNFKLWNEIGDTIPGEFDVHIQENIVTIKNAKVEFDSSSLNLNFMLNPEGRLAGRCNVHNLKLEDWFEYQNKIILDGDFYYDGQIANDKVQEWSFSADVLETGLLPRDTVTISVSGMYDGKSFELSEPLIAILNGQYVEMDGSMNIQSNQSEWTIGVTDLDLALLPIKIKEFDVNGIVTGSIQVNGELKSPSIEIDISIEDFKTYLFSSSRYLIKGNIQDPMNLKGGEMNLTFENGKWSGIDLGEGELDMTFKNGDIYFKDISTISGDNFLQASGKIIQKKLFFIDRFQMAYDAHYLAIPQPIEASVSYVEISVKPFIVHVDDGVVEGVLKVDSRIDGRIKLSNVDGGFINNFFPENKLDLSGLLFGEIGFSKTGSEQSASVDITMKNGQIYNQVFNDLTLSSVFKEGIVHVENFTLTNNEKTGMQVSGSIPLGENSRSNTLNITSHFSFVNMDFFTQFMPGRFPITGFLSGDFNLLSEGSSPLYEFGLTIENGFYDKIYFGNISGNGFYKDNTLSFNSFSTINSKGNITGSAVLPLELDFNSVKFGEKILRKPVDVNVKGAFKHMDFLTEYISTADSLRGAVNIELSITGGWDKLIRNGKLSLENCRLYTSSFYDPITDINGIGTLKNNILNFDRILCMMSGNNSGKKNLFVNGNVDLTHFFNPDYDLHITGENIVFKSLTDEIEGNVNMDLNISGGDTISFIGTVALSDLVLFKEFNTTVFSGEEPENEKGILLHYDIDFPIKETISLVNSQIDAKLTGELHYTKWGNNTADYSGELFFADGKFYYYSEMFTISEGLLSFTKKGFNPVLDVIAITDIEGEEIQVSFTGPLDQPTLMLSSESGFSQSDILELLTWGKRFEDQTVTYTGLGNQAAAKFEKWLDTQFDRKIMEMSGLNQWGILNDVQIEGATGLFDPKNTDSFSIRAGLSRKVSLQYAYHRSFSLTNPSHSVGIEYKVNRYLSLVGNVDENGQVHAKYRLRYSY